VAGRRDFIKKIGLVKNADFDDCYAHRCIPRRQCRSLITAFSASTLHLSPDLTVYSGPTPHTKLPTSLYLLHLPKFTQNEYLRLYQSSQSQNHSS